VIIAQNILPPPEIQGRLRHICIGNAQPLVTAGRAVLSGIVKRPAQSAVAVNLLGLAGDEQADLSAHGGLYKAVYAYPSEHYAFWRAQRRAHGAPSAANESEDELPPGFVGENLVIEGVLERDV
jgi:MOSC domain-containing protein YiiM